MEVRGFEQASVLQALGKVVEQQECGQEHHYGCYYLSVGLPEREMLLTYYLKAKPCKQCGKGY
jgi:hypothetical protein